MQIDHYFWINSDWAYLGLDRLLQIGKRYHIKINHKPVDLLQIYKRTGGIPLQNRSPERRAYRETELRRWTRRLGKSLNITPRHMCPDGTLASCLVISADSLGYPAVKLCEAIMVAEWCEERDISDFEVLRDIMRVQHLPDEEIITQATTSVCAKHLQDYTDDAVKIGIFGSPSYVYGDEIFWGQDRLEFLDETIRRRVAE